SRGAGNRLRDGKCQCHGKREARGFGAGKFEPYGHVSGNQPRPAQVDGLQFEPPRHRLRAAPLPCGSGRRDPGPGQTAGRGLGTDLLALPSSNSRTESAQLGTGEAGGLKTVVGWKTMNRNLLLGMLGMAAVTTLPWTLPLLRTNPSSAPSPRCTPRAISGSAIPGLKLVSDCGIVSPEDTFDPPATNTLL